MPKLTKFQTEALERRARRRAAWGLYSAQVRQNNLNRELDKCKTEEERKSLLDQAKRSNHGLWIG